MAKIIPNEEKVFMVSKSTNTTYSGSASLKAMQEWYTMEDVANTVKPYKVFTALLTQSGGSNWVNQTSGTFTVGVTYTFDTYNGIDDFSNIGGPSVAPAGMWDGYSFIATGTTPLVYTNLSSIDHDTGAPVVTVLENTLGNIWFTYQDTGIYFANSNNLFINNKVWSIPYNFTENSGDIGQSVRTQYQDSSNIYIFTNDKGLGAANDMLQNTPIEIRVYN